MSISLAINVNANTAAAAAGLRSLGSTAQEAMRQSGAATGQLQNDLLAASQSLERAATGIGRNFAAANDAIAKDAASSADAIGKVADAAQAVKFPSLTEKAAAALGYGAGAGFAVTQSYLEKTEALVVAKGKAIAIGVAIAAISATAAAAYAAYKVASASVGFIAGLFTGTSYQSDAIDSVIKTNDGIKELQRSLALSATEAHALQDALGRLGVDKGAYVEVWTSAERAMRTNTAELDRLGVKYKDNNGKLLETRTFLDNVAAELDKYREGWDRAAAATAMGAGSYEKVVEALKVTDAQLEQSKARLDDYVLGFGPERQAAIAAYERALREFKNEAQLTGQGFSAAISDSIMPAFTMLATALRDGFPAAVRAFRYSMATVVSLAYGLKTVFDVVADSAIGAITIMADGFVSLGQAAVKALQGDFAGAANVLTKAWQHAGKTASETFDGIVGNAKTNRDAMLLAWGLLDDNTLSVAEAKQKRLAANAGKKAFMPAPKEQQGAAPADGYQKYLDELDREIAKVTQSEYASKRLRAEQLAAKQGITDLTGAYRRITDLQAGDSAKAVEEFTRKLKEEGQAFEFETALLMADTVEREKLVFAMRKQLELIQKIDAAKQGGKPLTDEAAAQLQAETDAAVAAGVGAIDRRNAVNTSAAKGMSDAVAEYKKKATDMAAVTKGTVLGALQQSEDAFINFAKTGKLHLGSLFSFMAEEYLRQLFKMKIGLPGIQAAEGALAGGGSALGGLFSGMFSAFTGLFGGPRASGGPVNARTPYLVGERGPEMFVPSAAGSIVPNGKLGGGQAIDASVNNMSVGAGVSRAEMYAAIRQAQGAQEARIRRLQREGTMS